MHHREILRTCFHNDVNNHWTAFQNDVNIGMTAFQNELHQKNMSL